MMVCLSTKKKHVKQFLKTRRNHFLSYLYYFILFKRASEKCNSQYPCWEWTQPDTRWEHVKPPRNRETEAANVNKMAAFNSACLPKDLLSSLSAEVLYIILSYLPAKSLLNLSECNRRLRDLCQNCNSLWKHLCKVSCDSFDQKIKLIHVEKPYNSPSRQGRNYFLSTYFTPQIQRRKNLLSFCVNSTMFFVMLADGHVWTHEISRNLRSVNIELPVPIVSSCYISRIPNDWTDRNLLLRRQLPFSTM